VPEQSNALKKVGTYFEQKHTNYEIFSLHGTFHDLDGPTVFGILASNSFWDAGEAYHDYVLESHATYASQKPQKPNGSPDAMDLPTRKF